MSEQKFGCCEKCGQPTCICKTEIDFAELNKKIKSYTELQAENTALKKQLQEEKQRFEEYRYKPCINCEPLSEQLTEAVEFFKLIELGEDELGEIVVCEEWQNKWWQQLPDEYDDDELCPLIDCGVCIAKQFLQSLKNKEGK